MKGSLLLILILTCLATASSFADSEFNTDQLCSSSDSTIIPPFGVSCFGCIEFNIVPKIVEIESTIGVQDDILRKATDELSRASSKKSVKVRDRVTIFTKKIREESTALKRRNTQILSILSPTVRVCINTLDCVSVSNIPIIFEFMQNSRRSFDLMRSVVRELRVIHGAKIYSDGTFLRKARIRYEKDILLAVKFPGQSVECR